MKGFIYAIKSPNTEEMYIGSTTNIPRRWSGHLTSFRKLGDCASKTGSMSWKILEKGGGFIEVLEEIEFEDRNELKKRELEYMIMNKDKIVNKSSITFTKYYKPEKCRDYYQKNRDQRIQYQRMYRRRIRDIFA
jgi:hypothetical protein